MKAANYDESLRVAGKPLEGIERLAPDHVASDCPVSKTPISQESGHSVVHPVALLRDAYGLGETA